MLHSAFLVARNNEFVCRDSMKEPEVLHRYKEVAYGGDHTYYVLCSI